MRTRPSTCWRRVGALCLLLLVVPVAARTANDPQTLAEALENVAWDPNGRALLMVLDPASVRAVPAPLQPGEDPFGPNGERVSRLPAHPLAPPGPGGYALPALGETFNRQLQRWGRVTVLAPLEMVVLNTRPGPPNLSKQLDSQQQNASRLLATLSPAQWRKVGGAQGIGRGDLEPDQQAIFDGLLPDPFTFSRTTTYYKRRRDDPAKVRTLTAGERAGVRLRIVLQTNVDARRVKDSGLHPILFNGNRNSGTKEFLDFVAGPDSFQSRPDDYGQLLSRRVPNRLKNGDLRLSNLAAPVSLVPASDGAPLTLGEIVRRVGAANHLELHADQRLASKPVWTRGPQTADSGDVLRALCLCVSGAFRQVGPAFVLTSDVAGLGARRAIVDEWLLDAQRKEQEEEVRLQTRMARQNPAQYLSFADDDPVPLDPLLKKQVLAAMRKKGPRAYSSGGVEVSLNSLPSEQRVFLQRAANALATVGDKAEYAVTTERVHVSLGVWRAFVIPGAGQLIDTPLRIGLEIPPPGEEPVAPTASASPQTDLPPATLLITPNTAKDAITAVNEAARRGLAGVWINVGDGSAGIDALTEAAKAGASAKVPVWGVVRLLRRPRHAPAAAAAVIDINVRNETAAAYAARRKQSDPADPNEAAGDPWLVPDAPGVPEGLRARLAALARVPHLAGLVLRDVLPPGYRGRKVNPSDGNPEPRVYGTAAEMGYTPAHRLAFLRAHGADPLDIVPYFFYGKTVPFFPDAQNGNTLADDWAAWRNDCALVLLRDLARVVRAARPHLPLLLRGETARPSARAGDEAARMGGLTWYVAWDKPDDETVPLPRLFRNVVDLSQPFAVQVRPFASAPVWLSITAASLSLGDVLARAGAGWDGLVLDLSDLASPSAFAWLDMMGITP